MRIRLALIVTTGLVAAGWPLVARQSPDLGTSTVFREIGPTRQGNRYVDFAVVESTPRVFYVAAATGGLFKTENNGQSFTTVFERQPVASLGAVAVSQSNPDVVYLGTGEGNNSRSTYWGDGVYVSRDAGKSWTHAGLDESQHIARIVVHPADPNTAYVAALGHLYSANEQRGLYKTTDGGKSWTKPLGPKEGTRDIGVVDVAMDPKNPNVLYASAYDKVRRPWTFGPGGPGSALYKTTDAGKSWTKLGGGLPASWLGRIGVSISRQDPNTVYAVVEVVDSSSDPARQRLLQGFGETTADPLFRSDDAGKTWRQVAPPAAPAGAPAGGRGGGRGGYSAGDTPYYYSQVRVDPNDRNHVVILSTAASQTFDAGQTWRSLGFGGDNHALWIDPKDSQHMLLGYDHGIGITFDGGDNWFHPDYMPGAQLYAIGFDFETPYNVYGGLQDNGSHKGPSTMPGGGNIPFEAWSTVGGGDGQYNEVDWSDSRWLYNEFQFGTIQRVDQQTGAARSIQYRRPPGQEALRFNWCAPILVSPHDPNVIYHGANVLLRSPNRGDTWEEISPDLTVNAPDTRDGTGNVTFATITTIAESPVVPGLLWVGTDDGNVQVSKDDGKTWTNVRDRIPGHPGYWVSRVEASHADPAVAYVTVTGLRNDDFRPFIWKTTDFGQSWTSIAGNLPNEAVNVVREDPYNANLLFAGTDLSVRMSLDAGKTWTKLEGMTSSQPGFGGGRGGGRGGGAAVVQRGLMPTNPVLDLKIHPRDHELIVGTHGLGFFIADISALEQMTPQVIAADAQLFEIPAFTIGQAEERGAAASTNFAGMSRPQTIPVRYYLRRPAAGAVTVAIFDGSRQVAEYDASADAGLNTVWWDRTVRRPRLVPLVAGRGGRGGGGGGGGRFGGRGGGALCGGSPLDADTECANAGPGEYRVVLSVANHDYTQTLVIR